jgi:sugar/nucleoside kinase (ribokinase family)
MIKKVYSYGIISTSRLLILENDFPKPDLYAEVKDSYIMTGGEAANSSIVLSKLGLKVKLDGNWLGNNDDELNTRKLLDGFGIDTSRITVKDGYRGASETVVAAGKTRTIFGTYGKLFTGEKQWNSPDEQDIIDSDCICLDPFLKEEALLAAKLCKRHNKPYVTVDCRHEDEVAQNAESVIISGEFRSHQYPEELETVFEKYKNTCRGLVILTSGDRDILYSRNGRSGNVTPYEIEVIDTAGAGDSFRSGIIYGLLNGWSDEKTIDFASALAALVCNSFPGVLNAPDLEQVTEFMGKGKL